MHTIAPVTHQPDTRPRGRHWSLPLLIGLAMLNFVAESATACRYTVREVGFVDLDNSPYALYGVYDSENQPQFRTAFLAACAATFVDANISPEPVNLHETPDHPASEAMSPGVAAPALVLRSPHGKSLTLALPAEGQALERQVWDVMESVVTTPVRDRVLTELIEAYAVILIVEGVDTRANERVAQAVEGAMETWEQLRPRLPKPVKVGPRVITITRQQAARERVFLWAMGIDIEASNEPWAAVLFGRGKLAGEALEGWLITQTDVYRHLAIVGQDCECSLDRAWLRGRMIPLVWGEDRQKAVVEHVGFDAENPLIQAEMSRILSRGPNGQAPVGLPDASGEDDFLLGYVETTIQAATAGTETDDAASLSTDNSGDIEPPLNDAVALAEPVNQPVAQDHREQSAPTSPTSTPTTAATIAPVEPSPWSALGWTAAVLIALVALGTIAMLLRARAASA